jgi:hypothetical protein
MRNAHKILAGQYEGKIKLGDNCVDWTVILKRIWNNRMQGSGFCLLDTKCGPFGFVGDGEFLGHSSDRQFCKKDLFGDVRHLYSLCKK